MNEQSLFFSIDNMALKLRGVVRNVVNHLHPKVLRAAVEHFRKNLANAMENDLPVRE
jgi:hypothetical protein